MQNVQTSQAATEHLPKTNFHKKPFAEKSRKDSSSEKLLNNFITERHESQSKSVARLLSNATLSGLFVKYNTAILSRATLERLFSLGKDVVKQKRSGLSDQWKYIGRGK